MQVKYIYNTLYHNNIKVLLWLVYFLVLIFRLYWF